MPDYDRQRAAMVRDQLRPRGVRDERVLAAMGAVPRELFVAERDRGEAYRDGPVGIGHGQTISQPVMVAEMVQAAQVRPGDRVLEVGAGSGYAAAVLAELAERVVGIERHADLAERAEARLRALGYDNAEVRAGDGSVGLAELAPFDVILVSAGGPSVPQALLSQLAIGGRLVMPVGPARGEQDLTLVRRQPDGTFERQTLGPVRFVPLIGEGGWGEAG